MTYLYIDLESIPAQTQRAKDRIASTVKPPAQMKKAETIAAWEKDGREQAVIEAIEKTSFDGGLGHVCCIAWAVGNERTDCSFLRIMSEANERCIIHDFFHSANASVSQYGDVTVVGHYISGFDIRFLTQRAIVLGVKLPNWWPHEAKPWGNSVLGALCLRWDGFEVDI